MGSYELPEKSALAALLNGCEESPGDSIPELKPRFRLSTLFLAMTSAAVCLAVARAQPEVAMVLVLVMAMALIRVLFGVQLYANAGSRLSFGRETVLYLNSICAVVAIGGFVVLAFSLTLGAGVGLGLLIARNVEARETEWVFGGFIAGWILGLVAAFITGGWLVRAIWFTNLGPNAKARAGNS